MIQFRRATFSGRMTRGSLAAVAVVALLALCGARDCHADGINSAASQDLPLGASGNTYVKINASTGMVYFGTGNISPTNFNAWINPTNGYAQFTNLQAPTVSAPSLMATTLAPLTSQGGLTVNATTVNATNMTATGTMTAGTVDATTVNATTAVTTPVVSFTNSSSVLNAVSAATINELEGASCASGYALTRTSSGAFGCILVTTIDNTQTNLTIPACGSGQFVTANGAGFSCAPLPGASITMPNCTGGGITVNGVNLVTDNASTLGCSTSGGLKVADTDVTITEPSWGTGDKLYLDGNQVSDTGGNLYINYGAPSGDSVIIGGTANQVQNLNIANGQLCLNGKCVTSLQTFNGGGLPLYVKAVQISGYQQINANVNGTFWGGGSVAAYCHNTSGQVMQLSSNRDSGDLVAITSSTPCLSALCMEAWPTDGHPISTYVDGGCDQTNGCSESYMHIQCSFLLPGYSEPTVSYPSSQTSVPAD